jgi:hypothetical protein
MKLLYTYESKDDGDIALRKIVGDKRLASERDDTATVYNLFGIPSWGNFYRLELFNLVEFKEIMAARLAGLAHDEAKRNQFILTLQQVSRQYEIEIPRHWLL